MKLLYVTVVNWVITTLTSPILLTNDRCQRVTVVNWVITTLTSPILLTNDRCHRPTLSTIAGHSLNDTTPSSARTTAWNSSLSKDTFRRSLKTHSSAL